MQNVTKGHWECLFAVRYSTYEHSIRLRQQSLDLARAVASQSDLAWELFELAEVHRIFGASEKAIDYYEQAQAMFEKMNMIRGLGFDQRARGDLALMDGRYSDALSHYQKFDAHVIEDNHLWGMAQSRAKIGLAYAYLGNTHQARREMRSALTAILSFRQDDLSLHAMLAEPVSLFQEGKLEAAVELASFLQAHPGSWNETKQIADDIIKSAAGGLPQEVAQAAIERGKSLELNSVVEELTRSPIAMNNERKQDTKQA